MTKMTKKKRNRWPVLLLSISFEQRTGCVMWLMGWATGFRETSLLLCLPGLPFGPREGAAVLPLP